MIKLPEHVKAALVDRLEGWELVDFLQITIEDVVEAFEETIIENLEDVEDFLNLRDDTENDEE